MNKENIKGKIKIIKDGPYIVSGNIPLAEKLIVSKGKEYELKDGRKFPDAETYALCRCGKSKDAPFCDGAHVKEGFKGDETASRMEYHERARLIEGPNIDLLYDQKCAFARFCHRADGTAWELARSSETEETREEVIKAAGDCPTGRLTAVDKDGTEHEPFYEPSIDILQEPERGVSSGIFVKGGIPIESSDGTTYELRNRVVLCRCGNSKDKPFCDGAHLSSKFIDKL